MGARMKRTAINRKTPMRRTRKEPRQTPPLAYDQGDIGELRVATIPRVMSLRKGVIARIDGEVRAVPKHVKARPGKRAPTVNEREWMDAIVEHGCIACWLDGHQPRPCCPHHIISGGRRLGHLFTIPLCDPGHHQNGAPLGLICRHPYKARFESRYGTEFALLKQLQIVLLPKLSFDPRSLTT
jgi:hypothetical protein